MDAMSGFPAPMPWRARLVEVSGAPTQRMIFDDLDLARDRVYQIDFWFKNATGSVGNLQFWADDDETGGNYDREIGAFTNTTNSFGRSNVSLLGALPASTSVAFSLRVLHDAEAGPTVIVSGREGQTTAITWRCGCMSGRNYRNVRRITLYSDVAASIAPKSWGIISRVW